MKKILLVIMVVLQVCSYAQATNINKYDSLTEEFLSYSKKVFQTTKDSVFSLFEPVFPKTPCLNCNNALLLAFNKIDKLFQEDSIAAFNIGVYQFKNDILIYIMTEKKLWIATVNPQQQIKIKNYASNHKKFKINQQYYKLLATLRQSTRDAFVRSLLSFNLENTPLNLDPLYEFKCIYQSNKIVIEHNISMVGIKEIILHLIKQNTYSLN